MTDLDVTWGFDLHAFLQERSQKTPVAGDSGDGTAEMMDSSQKSAMDASPVPLGRAQTAETMDSPQGGTMDAPRSRRGGPKQLRRWINLKGARWTPPWSRQGGSTASQAHQHPPAPTKRTAMIPPRSFRGRQPTSLVTGDGYPQQQGAGSGVRANACRVNLLNVGVRSRSYVCGSAKWTEFASILESTSWTTEDAMALMGRRTCCGSVCMPSGFPKYIEPPPHSVAEMERSKYKVAWRAAMKTELHGHETTETYETATPPRGGKPVGAK